MFGLKNTKRERAERPDAPVGGASFELRGAIRGFALMAAMGFSVSALITGTPRWLSAAVSAELPHSAAASVETAAGDLSDFYKNDSMVLLSLPELKAEADFVARAFTEAPLLTAAVDFADYVSVVGKEEADQRVREIEERKAREAREKAEREARIAQQQALIRQGGYVRFNRQGIPISQKTGLVPLDANGVPVSYSRCITGRATAYNGGSYTATGTRPMQGSVAVNPRQIPYGTRMWIVSTDGSIVYGLGVAEDTGGFIYWDNGPTIDVYLNSESDCNSWGVRGVNIYILD